MAAEELKVKRTTSAKGAATRNGEARTRLALLSVWVEGCLVVLKWYGHKYLLECRPPPMVDIVIPTSHLQEKKPLLCCDEQDCLELYSSTA